LTDNTPLLLLLLRANRISCIRQSTTIYAITTAIYRPPIHTNDTGRGTDGFPLSVRLLPSSVRRWKAVSLDGRAGDTLRLTNNSHCRCDGEFMIDERRRRALRGSSARGRPARASHTIETIGAGRRRNGSAKGRSFHYFSAAAATRDG